MGCLFGIFWRRLEILLCQKLGKIFTGPIYKQLLSFTVIPDVNKSFIQNKTTFAKYCLIQWLSKLHRSFESHWVRQHLGMVGIVNAQITVHKTDFHRSRALQIVRIFNTGLLWWHHSVISILPWQRLVFYHGLSELTHLLLDKMVAI